MKQLLCLFILFVVCVVIPLGFAYICEKLSGPSVGGRMAARGSREIEQSLFTGLAQVVTVIVMDLLFPFVCLILIGLFCR